MRDLAAILAVLTVWAAVALTAVIFPTPGPLTAIAAVAAIALTVALTPHDNPTTRKDAS